MKPDPRLEIRFCPECGGTGLERRVPRRDDRTRQVCSTCGYIHYVGPALAAGAIIHDAARGRICLVRRAWDPGRGKWTFPGGFVDLDEEASAAALREAEEETGLSARIDGLVGIYNSLGPKDKRVAIVVFHAQMTGVSPRDSDEVTEVRWCAPEEIPWEEMAFASSVQALRDFLAMRR